MAQEWAAKAQQKYDMDCTYEEGALQDQLCFSRAGIKGTLDVGPDAFDFHAKLGFLISAFKERIESELKRQLDAMLASPGSDLAPSPEGMARTDGDVLAPDPLPAATATVKDEEAHRKTTPRESAAGPAAHGAED